jgi:hypothetical protein
VIISIYRFAPISSSHHCNKTIWRNWMGTQ